MNLIVDIGNSRIKIAIFNKDELIYNEVITNDSFVETAINLIEKFNCKNAIISAVGILNKSEIDQIKAKIKVIELNPNIVWLDYINKGALNPDPMPRMGPTYKNVMALNRYLLNRETGKIKKGKHWLLFNGVRKCCEIDFAIIDPQLEYKDKSGNTFSGKSLVKSKKIDLNSFHYNEFKSIYNCLPY